MTSLIDRYFNTLAERLEKVRTSQADSIRKAAKLCAKSIAAEKLVFTFGTGHGALPALESFPRTGTIVGFRPIVESTMISFHHVWGDMGARQYRFIHSQEGYGKAILSSHQIDSADTMILFSHSGINAVIMDIAVQCKERGVSLIGVTSLPHSSVTPSRHSSGKRLFEVADVVVDTGIPLADAAIRIDGLDSPVGASSTSITIERSSFAGLGQCDESPNCSHSVYLSVDGLVTITQCRFERGTGGHYVKLRARRVAITGNSFDDSAGRKTNYMIDLSEGGTGTIAQNMFVQGPAKENRSGLIVVAAEARTYPTDGLRVEGNSAGLAPGAPADPAFVADVSGGRITVVNNRLTGMRAFEKR